MYQWSGQTKLEKQIFYRKKKKPYSKLESKIVAISLSPCPQQMQNSIPWDTKKCSATTKWIPKNKNLTLFYQTDLEPKKSKAALPQRQNKHL